jgi:hypothetical protein
MPCTSPRTASTAVRRASASCGVGSRICVKATTSWCNRSDGLTKRGMPATQGGVKVPLLLAFCFCCCSSCAAASSCSAAARASPRGMNPSDCRTSQQQFSNRMGPRQSVSIATQHVLTHFHPAIWRTTLLHDKDLLAAAQPNHANPSITSITQWLYWTRRVRLCTATHRHTAQTAASLQTACGNCTFCHNVCSNDHCGPHL